MDFATPTVHKSGNQLFVTHGSDDSLYVEFVDEKVQLKFESEKQGKPVYEQADFIRITYPGDKTKQTYRQVRTESTPNRPSDIERFPRQWSAYKSQKQTPLEGTDIAVWPPLNKSEVANLKAMNVHTVEALSNLPDMSLTWLGARSMRDKAKAWLESTKGTAAITSVIAENESLKATVAALQNQVNELASLTVKSNEKSKEKESK